MDEAERISFDDNLQVTHNVETFEHVLDQTRMTTWMTRSESHYSMIGSSCCFQGNAQQTHYSIVMFGNLRQFDFIHEARLRKKS